jgi:hypothetical protein
MGVTGPSTAMATCCVGRRPPQPLRLAPRPSHRSTKPNDSIIALCMALEAMENQPGPVELVGWL